MDFARDVAVDVELDDPVDLLGHEQAGVVNCDLRIQRIVRIHDVDIALGYMNYDYVNHFIATIPKDFVMSADISWDAIGSESSCGFVLRSDGNENAMNTYLATISRVASGHFLFLSGLVYKEFSDDKHLVDDAVLYDSKGRFWPKSPDFTLYLGIDPHPRIPHAVIFLLVRSDGLLFVGDELFIHTKTAKELVDAILVKQQGKTLNVITIDASAFIKDPSTGSCLGFDLVDAGIYPVPLEGSKDMARGILKVRELLVGAERGPRIYIHRGCRRLRYELTHYVWDNWKKDTTNIKGEKQKPIDKDDHLLEALRRICLLEPDHVPIGPRS